MNLFKVPHGHGHDHDHGHDRDDDDDDFILYFVVL